MNSFQYLQYLLTKGLKNIWTSKTYYNKYELFYDAEHLMSNHELFTLFIQKL